LGERNGEFKPFPEYFVFTEVELFSLILCMVLDISEYVAAVLLLPVVGDMLDVVGIIACLAIFRWTGIVSLFELVPGADILPIFIITWLAWYFLKKQERRTKKTAEKWFRSWGNTVHRFFARTSNFF